MDGSGVEGRNGVGGLLGSGWMIQPLHEVNNKVMSSAGKIRFIFFSSLLIVSRFRIK
jgi:hypothetical protein